MWRIGQKVVCINDVWRLVLDAEEIYPVKGIVYTIRDFCKGKDAIWLYEIRNKKMDYVDGFAELSFYTNHFRPVIDRSTDISFAYEILSDATTKVTIDLSNHIHDWDAV